MPPPTADGPAGAYRPRPNGSTRLAAASQRHAFRGGMSSRRAATIDATCGKANSPMTTLLTTGGKQRLRPTPLSRTDTACTTPLATCGNGAPTPGGVDGSSRAARIYATTPTATATA